MKMVLQPPGPLRRLIFPYSRLTVPIKEFWNFPLYLPVSLFPVFPSAAKISLIFFLNDYDWQRRCVGFMKGHAAARVSLFMASLP